MAPRVSYAPEMMAGGGKAAELRKGAKYVAKKGTGPKNKDFAKDASKTAKNVASASLFGLFGGAFAPRGRELESLANPYGSLGRRETPEEYDWRARVKGGAWNLKPLDRSGKINPKDPKTW